VANDDANPYGMQRPFLVGSGMPKARDHKPPRMNVSGGSDNTSFNDPDPAPPHGIPRPNTFSQTGSSVPAIDPSRLITPSLYDQDKRSKITIDSTKDSGHIPVDLSGSVKKRKLKVTELQRSKKALKSIQ
jgi:hypothetical protein